MLMTTGLKVAHLSTHKSLAEAVRYVRTPVLVEKLDLTIDSLRRWGLESPRIAVSSLNPHGGEGGMLGREEIEEIAPAVRALQEKGEDVVGPLPADSVFTRAIGGEFDAVLALYHDQGHIAIKVHNFEDSVTATMGIPFVRTSVDHGTAFDIAGKNLANPKSLAMAVDAAIDMMNGSLA
jgi:4-hydroxythreonine-4-phosphate dehydrogenase